MAEGYLRHVAGERYEAMSAGIEPKGLNPLAVEAMAEIGIDISHQQSKDVGIFLGENIPYIVTVARMRGKSALSFRARTSSYTGVSMTPQRRKEHTTNALRCFDGSGIN
jgi:protein-tyrosine-phosphatase